MTSDPMSKTQSNYSDLSPGKVIYLNVFGEPFFAESGSVLKVSPETGEREEVCSLSGFNPGALEDYWTGDSLKQQWELAHGAMPADNFLVPVTPFVLGGEFDISNLMSIDKDEAIRYYKRIRDAIRDLPDGATVKIEVKP